MKTKCVSSLCRSGPSYPPSPPSLPSLKIPPSITGGGFVSKFVMFILKAEAVQIPGSSQTHNCVYLFRFFFFLTEICLGGLGEY